MKNIPTNDLVFEKAVIRNLFTFFTIYILTFYLTDKDQEFIKSMVSIF